MRLGGMRTVTTGARRPLSVAYVKTVSTATAEQTMAMMANRSTTRPTELCTGVCNRQWGRHHVVGRVIAVTAHTVQLAGHCTMGEGHVRIM